MCQKIRSGIPNADDDAAKAAGRKLDDVCKLSQYQRCADLSWDRYTTPGTHGDPCSGYHLKASQGAPRVTGTLVCDACMFEKGLAYRGVEGAPCTGFWWRTGEPLEGTLAQCED